LGVFWCTRAARREFREETGLSVNGDFIALGTIKQPGGKVMYAWALAGDCDAGTIQSNSFQMPWPPKSGTYPCCPDGGLDLFLKGLIQLASFGKLDKEQHPFIPVCLQADHDAVLDISSMPSTGR